MRAATKKRTIFLSVIALLGLLYSTVWILVLLDAEAILTQVPDLPNMPEVLAQQYPLLNAVAWLIRADLFDVVARGLDPMCMVIEINQHSIRHIGIAMFVTWICVFLLLNRTLVLPCLSRGSVCSCFSIALMPDDGAVGWRARCKC
ncbi:MAG: hypothetical protein GX174_09145 [Lentisphaerae bacterium]|jgi:hypothetical protein|nr:hypothetical protein [Lentisphaerota bacterium]